METLISDALLKSMSYQDYKILVDKAALVKTNTGDKKEESLAHYTQLNNRRMKRWDKILKVPSVIEKKIRSIKQDILWLVLVESWCADAAHILPVLNKLAALNPRIDLKVVLRDENPALMNTLLTDGNKSIPKLLILDANTGSIIHIYGPRPTEATAFVNRFKVKYGKITPEFMEDLQHWYNSNKGINVMDDIIKALKQFEPSFSQ